MGKKIALVVVLVFILIFFKQIAAGGKVALLISQQFEQIPIKPLHTITPKPTTEKATFELSGKQIVGDLFIPKSDGRNPAIIIVMGVDTGEENKQIILSFAETLARLGYVVFWPRSEVLDLGTPGFEDSSVFVEAFNYLTKREDVEKERISFVGFSIGSSFAMAAAEDESINKQAHALVFFGGFYNVFDYLDSLATKTMVVDGQTVAWEPGEGAISHTEKILEKEGVSLGKIKDRKISEEEKERLLRLSPDQTLDKFSAAIFILHEKADNFVPYVESIKLNEALMKNGREPKAFHLANLFEHVQPKDGFSPEIIKEFAGLFGFLHKVFMYL